MYVIIISGGGGGTHPYSIEIKTKAFTVRSLMEYEDMHVCCPTIMFNVHVRVLLNGRIGDRWWPVHIYMAMNSTGHCDGPVNCYNFIYKCNKCWTFSVLWTVISFAMQGAHLLAYSTGCGAQKEKCMSLFYLVEVFNLEHEYYTYLEIYFFCWSC